MYHKVHLASHLICCLAVGKRYSTCTGVKSAFMCSNVTNSSFCTKTCSNIHCGPQGHHLFIPWETFPTWLGVKKQNKTFFPEFPYKFSQAQIWNLHKTVNRETRVISECLFKLKMSETKPTSLSLWGTSHTLISAQGANAEIRRTAQIRGFQGIKQGAQKNKRVSFGPSYEFRNHALN